MLTRRLPGLLLALLAVFPLTLAPSNSHAEKGAATGSPSAVRQTLDLADGWRFHFGEVPAEVTAASFDDSGWQDVSIPHTWNRVGSYDPGVVSDSNHERGTGWYRLKVTLASPPTGQRQFLQFDGVATIAEVWVNGRRAGEHRGAYSRFRFDITDALRPGENLLVVKADNSAAAPGSPTEHVLPLGGDYFLFGGIYRGVQLVTTASTHIDMLDFGGPGVYLRTPSVTREQARVDVLTRVRNLDGRARELFLLSTIRDAQGQEVATVRTPVTAAAGEQVEVRQGVTLDNPRLWNGRADPYLYQVTAELREADHILDRVTQPLGLRSFAFDADRGFILNGKPLRLHGVSRHQDRAGKGWALSPEDHLEDMATMLEMGVNTIRQAHYQQAQEWTDAADRHGMVVWAELPYTHETSASHDPLPSPALVDNARVQLIELIRQNFNHPSIMIWGIGNEVNVGTLIHVMRNGGKGEPSRPQAMLQTLHELARQEDEGRITGYADCCEGTVINLPGMGTLSGIASMTAYNRYFGWYYGEPADFGKALDGFHASYPGHPIGVSEYGAGGAFTQHTDNPEGGPPNPMGRPHPEEYQSWYHEQSWKALAARPYLAATWIWNMFDFAAPDRAEGESVDINDKGLVHHDHRQRKDAFYFYKAQWSNEPVLHITGRRYVDRAYPVTEVRAYSNAPRASLNVNGRAMGEAECRQGICAWPGVHLAKGSNTVRVTADIDGRSLSDSVSWNAPDASEGLSILAGTLTGVTTADGRRFGSDNFFTGGKGQPVVPFLVPDRTPKPVAATRFPELYEAYREGAFSYELPLPDGRWTVTLHIAEFSERKADKRRFDVWANDRRVLQNFNPAAEAGGTFRAVTPAFPVTVTGGKLQLRFDPQAGDALVSAISVQR